MPVLLRNQHDNTHGALSGLPVFNYVGRVNCVTGYGQAARHQVWALRKHGLKLRIHDAGSVGDPDPEKKSAFVQSMKVSDVDDGSCGGSIIHLSPNIAIEWLGRLPKPHILVSMWETTRLPQGWAEMCNRFDQVWCATRWQYQVYLDSGVDESKLVYVPYVMDPELFEPEGPTLPQVRALAKTPQTKIFGSLFQWTERKAPAALIGGFLQAFHQGEDVALVIKSYFGDDPNTGVEQEVRKITQRYRVLGVNPRIVCISQRWTDAQVMAFYRSIDCYVQPHRGEGFGLPIVESMLMGRPTIATGWSAPAEYGHQIILPVAYTLEPPHSMDWQPFYTIDQQWASPSASSVAHQMRRIYMGEVPPAARSKAVDRFKDLMDTLGQSAHHALRRCL